MRTKASPLIDPSDERLQFRYELVGTSGPLELWYHRWGGTRLKWRVYNTVTEVEVGKGFGHYPSMRYLMVAWSYVGRDEGAQSTWTMTSHPWSDFCDSAVCGTAQRHLNGDH